MTKISKYSWIHSHDLQQVFQQLLVLQADRPDDITSELLAELTKRMIACELRPGGPYKNLKGEINTDDNQLIHMFFVARNISLPSLEKYLACTGSKITKPTSLPGIQNKQNNSMHYEVYKIVYKNLEDLGEPVHGTLQQLVEAIYAADKNKEIGLISYFFGMSLLPEYRVFPNAVYKQLGMANVYCWASYTVYDDFLDEEGRPSLLPAANVAMRRSIETLNSLSRTLKVRSYSAPQLFDRMDQANIWELQHCRFRLTDGKLYVDELPDYKDKSILAERAWGHLAGVTLILESLDKVTDLQKRTVNTMLKHYLIAKQLSDDIHDWQKDLSAGHISPVVAALLAGANIKVGTYVVTELIAVLRTYFWHQGFADIAETIVDHAAMSQKCVIQAEIFTAHCEFENLIATIEKSITRNLRTHTEQRKFLEAYSNKGTT